MSNKNNGVSTFFSNGYDLYKRLGDKASMKGPLKAIPARKEIWPHQGWSCGINSATKTIYMAGYTDNMSSGVYKTTFLLNVPRGFRRTTTGEVGVGMWLASGVVDGTGVLLAPATGGTSLVASAWVGGGLKIASTAAVAAATLLPTDAGPRPGALAAYINKSLSGSSSAQYTSYGDFSVCTNAIRKHLKKGNPVIVFWSFSAALAHYVNVVGISKAESDTPSFIVMNTDNRLYCFSAEEMEKLMKPQFMSYDAVGISSDRYHIIHLKKKKLK